MVSTNAEYIGEPVIGDMMVTLSHIEYIEPPTIEDISVDLTQNEITYQEYIDQ